MCAYIVCTFEVQVEDIIEVGSEVELLLLAQFTDVLLSHPADPETWLVNTLRTTSVS